MLPLAKPEEETVVQGHPAHQPVLLEETLDLLAPIPGDTVVDATLGAGGHAEALLCAVGSEGRLFGIDRDPGALEAAGHRLARFGRAFVALRGNHCDMEDMLARAGVEAVDRILFDLGLSSIQLDDASRGFSFRLDGPLDMRMDPDSGPSAAELLATLTEDRLREILWRYGEERRSRAIARSIITERERHPLQRTSQLARLVERAVGGAGRRYRIHPATRTFQALRIAVNQELGGLEPLIAEAAARLRVGGRLAVISFHSLEDRAVKRTFKSLAARCVCPPRLPICGCGKRNLIRILTAKPVRPSEQEIRRNSRARSAKLRVAERL